MVIEVRVKQALLRSVLPDGTEVLLVVLHDDRCAILRNSVTIHEAGGDTEGIDGAVQRFMAMTEVSDVLGAPDRPPGVSRDAGSLPPSASASAATELTPPATAPGTSL